MGNSCYVKSEILANYCEAGCGNWHYVKTLHHHFISCQQHTHEAKNFRASPIFAQKKTNLVKMSPALRDGGHKVFQLSRSLLLVSFIQFRRKICHHFHGGKISYERFSNHPYVGKFDLVEFDFTKQNLDSFIFRCSDYMFLTKFTMSFPGFKQWSQVMTADKFPYQKQ